MIRKLLIAATFATASVSGTALAHGDSGYGRVIEVEPRVSVSFGTGYYDGFRVLFESGGARYWTYTPYRPGRVIVLPPPHRMHPVRPHVVRHTYGWNERRGWDGWDDRRDWRDDHRHDRREDRRDDRRDDHRHRY